MVISSVSQSCLTLRCQVSLSITNSQSLLKLMSIESVMSSNYLILCCPLLHLHSIFPAPSLLTSTPGPSRRAGVAVLQFTQFSAQEPFCWAQQSSAVPLRLVTWVCHSPTLWSALPSC